MSYPESEHPTSAGFQDTRWTQVLHKVRDQTPEAPEALETLCRDYWPPLYAYLRRQGRSAYDAQDLTQGFFVHLLAKDRLHKLHRERGKFRSFLLACLNNYVQNERDRASAEKRGGGRIPVPIDVIDAELRYGPEPAEDNDPAMLFERRWAANMLDQVLAQMKQVYVRKGEAAVFEVLRAFLTGEANRGDYAQAAAKLEKSEGAVRVAVTRLREDFRRAIREEVGRTVEDAREIDEEIRYLFSVFGTSAHQ